MKQFNQVITVEVSVDSIAKDLLEKINPEFKHKELLVEAIIGRSLSSDKSALRFIYNALNGYTDEVDFKVGDVVKPNNLRVYGYWTPESVQTNSSTTGDVLRAVVVDINPYADNKLKIQFNVPNKDGSSKTEERYINHRECNKIPLE